MVIVEDVEDGFGNFSFVFVIRVEPNLHFCFADGHEAHCES